MASLSSGWVFIGSVGTHNVFYTLAIAIRHALMRRQFGENNKPETLLMDYELH